MLRAGWHRFYSDFLLPDRLAEYRALLARAVELGYELHSIRSYRQALDSERPTGAKRLIIRRDVDTDVGTARRFFEIERDFEGRASYFFRLSTVDVPLMRQIEAAAGSEASYHFEEMSTFARARRLRTWRQVEPHLTEIQAEFRRNLIALRERTGLPMRIVAAHGDMANRLLGVDNYALLSEELRAELDIEAEVYDRDCCPGITTWISDDAHPRPWNPHDPLTALERGDQVVYLLTHPRHWRRNFRENFADDMKRLWAGFRYRAWPARA